MRQYGRMTNVLIGRQPLCSSRKSDAHDGGKLQSPQHVDLHFLLGDGALRAMQAGQKYTGRFANPVGDHRALPQLQIERSAAWRCCTASVNGTVRESTIPAADAACKWQASIRT